MMNKLFHMFMLTADEASKIASHPGEPHNHDFEELAKPPEIIKEVIKEYFKDDVK